MTADKEIEYNGFEKPTITSFNSSGKDNINKHNESFVDFLIFNCNITSHLY